MKILLVANPQNYFGIDLFFRIPNLGLCSIAGNLNGESTNVKVLDLILAGKNPKAYLLKVLKDFEPDIVGFSSMTFQYKYTLELVKATRNYSKKIKTVLGGYHSTVNYETISQSDDMKYFDFLIRGEGEYSFRDLVKAMKNKFDFKNVPGITYIIENNIVHNPSGCLIDLNELNIPDRNARIFKRGFHCMGDKSDAVETSRGCTFDCNFCSIYNMYGKSYRKYSIERVLNDIRDAQSKGAKSIMMTDDNITLDGKRYVEICRAIIDAKLNNIKYLLQAGVNGIKRTDRLAEFMGKSGVKWVFLGIENINDDALNSMSKDDQFDKNDTADVIKELRGNGISIIGGFIIGHPDDTEESIRANFEFAKKSKIDFPLFNSITPYPKTKIREELLKQDLITNKDDLSRYDCWEINVRTKHLSTEKIYEIRNEIEARYPFESGSFFWLAKRFPAYFIKLVIIVFFRKPSDVFRYLRYGFFFKRKKIKQK
jgi:radical SAM superfamily enzyme YgiQ (UPF0313 family)